jgi:endoglycosylceramidase
VEPSPGVFNETYIQIISDIIDNLEKHGIHPLIDVHQDVISTYFCLYDGAPTWLIDLSTSSKKEFPWPLEWDGTNPCPADRAWGKNYLAEATGAAFQDMYDNVNGMRDHFAIFYKKVASSLKNKDLLGYEIINEPWAGNIYSQPSLLLPGVAGSQNLLPFYDIISEEIRSIDDSHLIFYEPVTWGMIFNGSISGSGFTHVPGGSKYVSKSVFSFHYYCWWYGNDGEFNRHTCDEMFGPKVFDQVAEDVRVLGGAAMLTEWYVREYCFYCKIFVFIFLGI